MPSQEESEFYGLTKKLSRFEVVSCLQDRS